MGGTLRFFYYRVVQIQQIDEDLAQVKQDEENRKRKLRDIREQMNALKGNLSAMEGQDNTQVCCFGSCFIHFRMFYQISYILSIFVCFITMHFLRFSSNKYMLLFKTR